MDVFAVTSAAAPFVGVAAKSAVSTQCILRDKCYVATEDGALRVYTIDQGEHDQWPILGFDACKFGANRSQSSTIAHLNLRLHIERDFLLSRRIES